MMKKMNVPIEKAGVVAYRPARNGEPHVLLVSARKIKNQWIFPVGSLEKGESLEAAAGRECLEESGYRVATGEKLPHVEVSKDGRTVRFTFFLATVIGQTGQWETDRQRRWVPASQVVDALPDVFQGVARQAVRLILSSSGFPRQSNH